MSAALLLLPWLSASGYLKYLHQSSRAPITKTPYGLHLARGRLSLEATRPAGESRLQARADYDHEARAGAYFSTFDYRALGLAEPPSFLTMDQVIGKNGASHYRHRLYRGWVGAESETWLARFGRQRVAWGSCKLWNPTDVVNPYEPTAVEREERRGADSLYLRRAVGALGQAEAVYGLGGGWDTTDLLGRVKASWGPADLALMGGKVAPSSGSWTAGADLSASLWEGNAHAEAAYSDTRLRGARWRVAAGYEYNFSAEPPLPGLKDAWVTAEYYHNGGGQSDPARFEPGLLLSGREIALGRDYVGGGLQKDLHPLLKLEAYVIVSMTDGSHFLGPSLAWNAAEDLYLTLGVQRFGGDIRSEYGRLPNLSYFQTQYFF